MRKGARQSSVEGQGVTPGTLYVVATPIGNLEDITFRAVRVLKEAGLVAVEDTRVAKKLFGRYGIKTPVTNCFEHNEARKAPFIIEKLKRGVDVALISDAGTPGFSDPGFRLIKLAIENNLPVTAIPGPAAPAVVLSISGLPIDRFSFRGFVPQAAARRRRFLLELMGTEETFVLFESARRIKKTLEEIVSLLGDVDVVVAREMTKLHEEVLRGPATTVMNAIEGRQLKGEITLVVRTKKAAVDMEGLKRKIEDFLSAGLPIKDVARALARESGIPGAEVYKEALLVKKKLTS